MITKQELEKDLWGVVTAMRCGCISLNPVEAILYLAGTKLGSMLHEAIFQRYGYYSAVVAIGQQLVDQLTQALPENLKSKLPSIEDIENELGGKG